MVSLRFGYTHIVIGVAALFILTLIFDSCYESIGPDEVGVLVKQNKPLKNLESGGYFYLPVSDEIKVYPKTIQIAEVPRTAASTGDLFEVEVSAIVKWHISDPAKFMGKVGHDDDYRRGDSEGANDALKKCTSHIVGESKIHLVNLMHEYTSSQLIKPETKSALDDSLTEKLKHLEAEYGIEIDAVGVGVKR